MSTYVVSALYHFTPFEDPAVLKGPLLEMLNAAGVKGTILLANEGVNGTIAGTRKGIDAAMAAIRALPGCADLEHKESFAAEMPFLRMKVRLKKEIVTMGVPGVDPARQVGTYVDPQDWNDLINDPDTVLIDTRNDYEVEIGTFKGAVNPDIKTFREFPAWLKAHHNELKGKKVAMFCTGGIRCEKSTALARYEGIEDVFHLKGGILKYLEHVPENESTWQGDCFVFDDRVAVGHGLKESPYMLCRACRFPLTEEDRSSDLFVEGVSCPHCAKTRTDEQRERYAARQRQMELAEARGQDHLGAVQTKSSNHKGGNR